MSIYSTPYQARSRTSDCFTPLHDSKCKAPSILHAKTNPSINERIHLVKERTHLKGLHIASTPETKSLSKRVAPSPSPFCCRSSGILIPKPNKIVKAYDCFSKPSRFLKQETEISGIIAIENSPEELEKRRNWEICQAKLRERNPEALIFPPAFRESAENQRNLTQGQAAKNQRLLSSISSLDLSRSQLTFFPPDLVFLLPNLESIYLDRNSLKAISFKPSRSNHLTELNISGTQINELPAEIKFFTKLQILDVSYNSLSSIPEWVYSLKNLKVLDISENKIQKLSFLIGQLKKLETLVIRDNELKKIPPEINHLTNLILFSASNNLIPDTPVLNNLKKLQTLNLSHNQITVIGNEIVGLCSLKELFLNHNMISSISPKINRLAFLTRIVLRNNQLKTLPSEVSQLSFLIDLKVQHNPLETLPASMPDLKELYRFDYSPQYLTTLAPDLNTWLENFEFKFEGQGVTHLSRIEFT